MTISFNPNRSAPNSNPLKVEPTLGGQPNPQQGETPEQKSLRTRAKNEEARQRAQQQPHASSAIADTGLGIHAHATEYDQALQKSELHRLGLQRHQYPISPTAKHLITVLNEYHASGEHPRAGALTFLQERAEGIPVFYPKGAKPGETSEVSIRALNEEEVKLIDTRLDNWMVGPHFVPETIAHQLKSVQIRNPEKYDEIIDGLSEASKDIDSPLGRELYMHRLLVTHQSEYWKMQSSLPI